MVKFFDVAIFILPNLVNGSSQYHYWFWKYYKFRLKEIDQKSRNQKYPRLSFSQYLETGVI